MAPEVGRCLQALRGASLMRGDTKLVVRGEGASREGVLNCVSS